MDVEIVADFFSVLGDPTRLQILGWIYSKPKTVNEIRELLGDISLQALSYQLKRLEDLNIITYSKDPDDQRRKYYRLADKHVTHILNDTIAHIIGGPECDGILGCEETKNLQLLVNQTH